MRAQSALGPICFCLTLFAAAALLAQEATKKATIPDDNAQSQALTLIREVYKDDYSQATTPEKKGELAKKLLEKAGDSKDDATNQFVMLRVAKELAVQAGDAETAFQAVDEMANGFPVDALEMKVAVLAKVVPVVKDPEELKQLAEMALSVMNLAIGEDKHDLAKRLGPLVLSAAQRAKDKDLVKQVQASVRSVNEAAKAFQEAKAAMKTLEEQPTDPDANLAVGKYLCFTKGNWKRGRAMLALGSDAVLKALAMKEMGGEADAAEQVKLGDGWWGQAEKEKGTTKQNLEGRARYWYEKALPELTGLMKDKVEKRVASTEGTEVATAEPPSHPGTRKPVMAQEKGTPVKPGKDGWTVIFHSSDPSIWNSDVNENKERFAVSLAKVPQNIRFLRMRAAGQNGEVIIPIMKSQLAIQSDNGRYGWNGTNRYAWNGYFLGIYCRRYDANNHRGDIIVEYEGQKSGGFGFGDPAGLGGQGYTWAGVIVPQVVFEISVKSKPLAKAEQKFLLQ